LSVVKVLTVVAISKIIVVPIGILLSAFLKENPQTHKVINLRQAEIEGGNGKKFCAYFMYLIYICFCLWANIMIAPNLGAAASLNWNITYGITLLKDFFVI